MPHSDLGIRMKDYESVPRTRLVRRLPVMARLDGKAFHSLCRGMERPWDERFIRCMDETARALCEQIQGTRLAYVQSDEITMLLVDYDTVKTEAWFDSEIMKMCSVSAAIATGAFIRAFSREFPDRWEKMLLTGKGLPAFDARFWNLPPHEVANCFLWRQQDAVRNSIAMLGQSHFSPKQLHGQNTNQVQEILFQQHGINWNDIPTHLKRGRCIERLPVEVVTPNGTVTRAPNWSANFWRNKWQVVNEIPTFSTPEGRAYIEKYVAATPPHRMVPSNSGETQQSLSEDLLDEYGL